MNELDWIEHVGAQLWPTREWYKGKPGAITSWTVQVIDRSGSIQPTRKTLQEALMAAKKEWRTNNPL